jgi:dephospho-CoA kinase
MIIAGITGTIGTGKSTVAAMFAEMGAFIIDYDAVAHQVVEPGKPAWQEIADSFGKDLLNEDQTINRQKLAQIVFNNPEKLRTLDSIVHPAIAKEVQRLIDKRKRIDPDGLIMEDIPLLLEAGPEIARAVVEKIIVISASPEVQLKRLLARGMSEDDAKNRIKNQIPVQEKTKYADFVINNDGSLEETRKQVLHIYSQLTQKKTD